MKNRLLQLALDNKQIKSDYRIQASESGEEATVYLYGAIGEYFGIDPEQFVRDFTAITAPVIKLRIKSPGGDVFDARAIALAVKMHTSKVIGYIDGLAASASTYIATSCDELEIGNGSFFMIHNGWTLGLGNRHDFAKLAGFLEKVDGTIVDDYEAKTSLPREQLASWMDEETWFTAAEAVEHGFADRLFGDDVDADDSPQDKWNLSAYVNAPKALTEPPEKEEIEHDRAALVRRMHMLNVIG